MDVSNQAELHLRSYTEEDVPFLIDSWGSSYYSGSDGSLLSPQQFHSFHRPIRESFFKRPSSFVLVCCAKDDPWHIVGWLAYEQVGDYLVLHYLYVKAAFKEEGIANSLLNQIIPDPDVQVLFTHMTFKSSKIMGSNYPKYQKFKYVPHLI